MKTPEDEAFDELARKQGAWGGGFPAKRKMTMDKIHAEFYEKYVRYRTAFPKEYTAPQPAQESVAKYSDIVSDGGLDPRNKMDAQPAQEPHEYDWSMLEAAKESLREHMARIKELEAALAQPAQEPVACVGPWDGPTLTLLPRSIHQTFEHNQLLYAAPPQRPWVGLTDAEIDEGNKQSWVTKQAWESAVWWASEKLKEKNT